MAKGRFNRVGHLFVICMRTETELALSLVFPPIFLIMCEATIAFFSLSSLFSVFAACDTCTNIAVHPHTQTHTPSVTLARNTQKQPIVRTLCTCTHACSNTIRNSFDFSHSRRLGHKRLCWFEPAPTRFYRLQRKQITTCIEFCIGYIKKSFV